MTAAPDDLLLAIDCGTQSVRALLFDPNGNLAAKAQVALDGYVAAQPGWLEHDGDAFWNATAAGLPAALARPARDCAARSAASP